jgi:hypothetical protein
MNRSKILYLIPMAGVVGLLGWVAVVVFKGEPVDHATQAVPVVEDRPAVVSNSVPVPTAGFFVTNAIARPVKFDTPYRLASVLEKKKSLQTRLEALRKAGSPWSFAEVQALYVFLYETPQDAGLAQGDLNALKNEVLNRLKSQEGETIPLIRHMMNLYCDKSQDPVWREYCVQHLGTVFKNASLYQGQLLTLFDDALNEKEGSLAGTTLIAMDQNVGVAGLSEESLAEKALAIAGSPSYNAASRTTALQIAARYNDRRALSLARAILNGKNDTHLMVSALAVLGQMGEAQDRSTLNAFVNSSDIRLRGAATAALTKIGPS